MIIRFEVEVDDSMTQLQIGRLASAMIGTAPLLVRRVVDLDRASRDAAARVGDVEDGDVL